MAAKVDSPQLTDALAELETCLETPLVPGDLEAWVENARASLGRTAPLIRQQIDGVHRPELKQIAEDDPELLGRVEDLQRGDEKSIADLESLERTFGTLDDLVAEIEPDETKLKSQLDELVNDGLAFVIHVRKQTVAVRTWKQEAYDRDRGTVD